MLNIKPANNFMAVFLFNHKYYYFCISNLLFAQVAELVDALVSNTSSFGSAGSTPALGTHSKVSDYQRLFLYQIWWYYLIVEKL